MTILVVTDRADTDLEDIDRYLTDVAGPLVASDYAERFRSLLRLTLDFPGLGTPRPHLGKNVRMMVANPYLLSMSTAAMW